MGDSFQIFVSLSEKLNFIKTHIQNDFEPTFKAHHPVHLQERTTEEFHLWEVGAIKLVPLVTADPENLQLQSYILLDLLKR